MICLPVLCRPPSDTYLLVKLPRKLQRRRKREILPGAMASTSTPSRNHKSDTPDQQILAGTLDGTVEDLISSSAQQEDELFSLASSRALIAYFAKLGNSPDSEPYLDTKFLLSLLENGADINFKDHFGQTILAELARDWEVEAMEFVLCRGADLGCWDNYGRSALHIAAAMDYADMVQFLIDHGASVHWATTNELQTPLHYAVKRNALSSIKVLIANQADINARDYRGRTPIFLAAESGQSDAVRMLLEKGAPVGVYDDEGVPALSVIIEKVSDVARVSLDQFCEFDVAFRKSSFYLGYMECETRPQHRAGTSEKRRKPCPKSPLEVVTELNLANLIVHPAFLELLHVKWSMFASSRVLTNLGLNLFFTMLWTTLGFTLPFQAGFYQPIKHTWWRAALETLGLLMMVYFVVEELRSVFAKRKHDKKWRKWMKYRILRDAPFCHPRWPSERISLDYELSQLGDVKSGYWSDPWNVLEWVAYGMLLLLMITRVATVAYGSHMAHLVHVRTFSFTLIVIWLRFMRSCRVLEGLGLFISVLGHIVGESVKFTLFYMELFIPTLVGFWVLFGGDQNAELMGLAARWNSSGDLIFNLWMITTGRYETTQALQEVDSVMAQIMVVLFSALSAVVCINLYIALLSQTFTRVYQAATSSALLTRALFILSSERRMPKRQREKHRSELLHRHNPEVVSGTALMPEDHPLQAVARKIVGRIEGMEDDLRQLRLDAEIPDCCDEITVDDVLLFIDRFDTELSRITAEIRALKRRMTRLLRN